MYVAVLMMAIGLVTRSPSPRPSIYVYRGRIGREGREGLEEEMEGGGEGINVFTMMNYFYTVAPLPPHKRFIRAKYIN